MKTEVYNIQEEIRLLYVTADTFPEGIAGAYQKLHALLEENSNRTLYGISRPDNTGTITYFAAAEERFKGEAEQLGCETLVLPAGTYTSILLENYKTENIGPAFMQLLKDPKLDKQGYCVEMYSGEKDVRCMVRLNDH